MNKTAQRLSAIMKEKETNLAVNCDATKKDEVLDFADKVGSSICILKTHVDLLTDFDATFINDLQYLASKHNFLIFEDRKFADIGTISKKQYQDGLYNIASWADITNCHILPGPGIIEGLREVGLPLGRGLLLVAQMSSSGSPITPEYTKYAVTLAKHYADFVIGFITQEKLTDDPRFFHMTPGVKLVSGTDPLGQQYHTPQDVLKKGCNIMIVGRGISDAKSVQQEAEKYRLAGRF